MVRNEQLSRILLEKVQLQIVDIEGIIQERNHRIYVHFGLRYHLELNQSHQDS